MSEQTPFPSPGPETNELAGQININYFDSSHRGCLACSGINGYGSDGRILRHISFPLTPTFEGFVLCLTCMNKLAKKIQLNEVPHE